jgi:hypothetical protein
MIKTALGILTGILIFIAAGILANYWLGKMRREMEDKKPRIAWRLPRPRLVRENTLDRPLG